MKCTYLMLFTLLLSIVACTSEPAVSGKESVATPVVMVTETAVMPPTSISTNTISSPTPISTNTPAPSPTPLPATATPTPSPLPSAPSTPPPTPTLTSAPTAIPTAATIPIGEAQTKAGEEVTISGQVVATASFAKGYKFTLDDGSGRIVLLMWHNVYDDCWNAPDLNLGATVRATGEIGAFEGEQQIEPSFGSNVKVVVAGSSAAQQAIGTLGDYLGQRIRIEGEIIRVEGNSSGAKLFVGDESGEIPVFIWNSTLDRIANNQALGTPGTRVSVTGTVQQYRGNRELVPTLPYDVVVLP